MIFIRKFEYLKKPNKDKFIVTETIKRNIFLNFELENLYMRKPIQ